MNYDKKIQKVQENAKKSPGDTEAYNELFRIRTSL